ncbi:MAG TPA: S41 family peptidase, partial [Thermoanaerobaculia bacterium]|nr:S41 family peptidase [Thermoanaerobaculia bacterium]
KAVWFDYHEVTNTQDEPLSHFADRMFRFIDEHDVEKLVIDIRNNYGGNHALNRALVHGLIRAKKLQAPGTLFVLVGRRTFSAAMMFAVEIEKNTHAIFIGEPTGASPNGYGDPRRIVLPESGVTVPVSALYWQLSHPRDDRAALIPHVRVEP